MKKYIKLSILALSLAGLSSCDMDAPNQSSLDPSVVGYTEKMAESAIMGIHQSFGETNSYRGRFIPYYGMNTDVEMINVPTLAQTPDGAKNDICAYNATPNNTLMNTSNNAYAKFYEGIERANMVIDAIKQYGAPANRPEMAELLGEGMTLRAVLYLDLIKAWGDVPARFEPMSTNTMYQERTDRASIYVRLLSDLKEAEDMMPWPNANDKTKNVERVSKSFVKGLRARIALYAAGFSYRADGTVRRSNAPALSVDNMYKIVRDECEDVINSGKNKLGDFKSNFTSLCKDKTDAGNESLWEIPFSDGRGRVLYTWGVKHNAKDQYTKQAQGGVNGPLPYLYYDYDNEDVRRDITCVPYDWSNESKAKQQLRKVNKWCFGKLRYEWMNRIVTSTNDDGLNFQYMRLADVYLMAAEAINQISGPSDAWGYMEPVLTRALPAEKVAALKNKYTANKDAFFNGIVEQRGLEFAGEQLRKADLIRWNLIDDKLAEAKAKMKELRTRTGAYADLPGSVYTKTADDGETLIIYGLKHGETDDQGNNLVSLNGYEKTSWLDPDSKTGVMKIEDDLIEGLYIGKPSTHAIWPIWQTFIDNSNGKLNNTWLGF